VPAVEARRFSPAFQRLAVPAQGSFTIRSNADAAPFWLLHVAHGDICRAA
jgi:hypothetical protein